jgi:hypothetical protein
MLILQAPGQLIEKLSPLGVLHYGLACGQIFPVFDDLKVLFAQTQRGLAQLRGEGRISAREQDRLSGELEVGLAAYALAS